MGTPVEFESLLEELKPLLAREGVALQEETRFMEDLELSSLELLELVATLETKLGIEVAEDDFKRLDSVRGLREYLAEKGLAT